MCLCFIIFTCIYITCHLPYISTLETYCITYTLWDYNMFFGVIKELHIHIERATKKKQENINVNLIAIIYNVEEVWIFFLFLQCVFCWKIEFYFCRCMLEAFISFSAGNLHGIFIFDVYFFYYRYFAGKFNIKLMR